MNEQKKAKPETLPKPTYWPFFLALGLMFMFWGILTNWTISAVGLMVFSVAVAGWIRDLYKEYLEKKEHEL